MITTGGAFFKFSNFISQNDSSTPCEPTFHDNHGSAVANNAAAPAMIMVFAFVHAMIFNAPLMRVKVEPLAAAPFVIATALTAFASATGAA